MKNFLINLIPNKLIRERFKARELRAAEVKSEHKHASEYLFANYITPFISKQLKNFSIKPKIDLGTSKIIWQYWGQGIDDSTPEIVKICLNSVQKYKDDYEVILLTNDTVRDYLDLPDFVWDKLNNYEDFSMTYFSDLLRVILLNTYGGVWIDATILLTDTIPKSYLAKDFFVFQRAKKPIDAYKWLRYNIGYFNWSTEHKVNMLNSFIIAKKDTPILLAIQNLLLNYWEKESAFVHYFLFQILFNELIQLDIFKKYASDKISDLIPHLMQINLYKPYSPRLLNRIIKKSFIHKLTYWLKEAPDNSLLEYLYTHEL